MEPRGYKFNVLRVGFFRDIPQLRTLLAAFHLPPVTGNFQSESVKASN